MSHNEADYDESLMGAAHRLGMPYSRALRLTLTRVLDGAQKEGRWWVSSESVDRLIASRNEHADTAGTVAD